MAGPDDANPLEGVRRLMREARQYHTTVSLHINMLDAHADSPAWKAYADADVLARDADGKLRVPWTLAGRNAYHVSYAREWAAGLAQARIDGLCKMIPELAEAGTIHIDAFHSYWHHVSFNGRPSLSPGHGLTVDDEAEAQRKIFRYWRAKGIDVTSEGCFHLREDPFYGLQPMTWWDAGTLDPMEVPACLYCGGRYDRLGGDPRLGDSMHGEDLLLANAAKPDVLDGFLGEFCTTTLPWQYMNSLERESVTDREVRYRGGIIARNEKGRVLIADGRFVIREGDALFVPALWQTEREIIAYSRRSSWRAWALPPDWSGVTSVDVREIGQQGLTMIEKARPVVDGAITLSIWADQALSIVPCGSTSSQVSA